jgi:hypothetical protein
MNHNRNPEFFLDNVGIMGRNDAVSGIVGTAACSVRALKNLAASCEESSTVP